MILFWGSVDSKSSFVLCIHKMLVHTFGSQSFIKCYIQTKVWWMCYRILHTLQFSQWIEFTFVGAEMKHTQGRHVRNCKTSRLQSIPIPMRERLSFAYWNSCCSLPLPQIFIILKHQPFSLICVHQNLKISKLKFPILLEDAKYILQFATLDMYWKKRIGKWDNLKFYKITILLN